MTQALRRELDRARGDLRIWEDQDIKSAPVLLGGTLVRDPRIQWNLNFHGRRVAALERALRDAQSASLLASRAVRA